MKQILQNLRSGSTEMAEVPAPGTRAGHLLIQTTRTLVSAGTERMLVEFGKANWIEKARLQPDKVRMVIDKIRTDGLQPTIEAVINKLDQPLPLGYCNAGHVVAVGSGVAGFDVGDRVISNGKHAELVSVPVNLCARIPAEVSDEEASFTVLGAVALQGIRLVQPTLGETVVVTGLGLIGLVTVQLLRANGCRVLGVDFDPQKLETARAFGATVVNLAAGEDPLAAARAFSRGRGVDAVIVTAATSSSEPIHQAAEMCRKRGRIVLVGVTGLELSRADFFEKELTFQVSCSYGPGRHDPSYEEQGNDYPVGFVRWTEQRNFEAVLDMMADGRLNAKLLISHEFDIGEAEKAYELVASATPSLGILLRYPGIEFSPGACTVKLVPDGVALSPFPRRRDDRLALQQVAPPRVSFVGAGNYATAVLIPAFKEAGARLQSVASSGGVSGLHAGRKFGFRETTTDAEKLLSDGDTDAVVITTRHDTHARFVLSALRKGKHVFCEKPLCLTLSELAEVEAAYSEMAGAGHSAPMLMVGFNRRFAPQIVRIMELLGTVAESKCFVMTVNAGGIPADHWTQDKSVGGGRIIGEACHFIDLLRCLAGAPIRHHYAVALGRQPSLEVTDDKTTITLAFDNGSVGVIHYFANGHRGFPKERLEIFCAGRVLQLDNFRRLRAWGWQGFSKMNLWRQDKGQRACAQAFVDALRKADPAPIPVDELFEVSRTSIEIAEAIG